VESTIGDVGTDVKSGTIHVEVMYINLRDTINHVVSNGDFCIRVFVMGTCKALGPSKTAIYSVLHELSVTLLSTEV
jgi:hypothetical protein